MDLMQIQGNSLYESDVDEKKCFPNNISHKLYYK